MSLTYRIIGLGDLARATKLLEMGYNEVASRAKLHPLKVNWQQYQRFVDANLLQICGCFDRDILVGFVGLIKLMELWGSDSYVAEVQTIYLHPSYRKGLNGYKLIRFAEKVALAMDCKEVKLPVSCRSKNHLGKPRTHLFASLGYQFKEAVFIKRL